MQRTSRLSHEGLSLLFVTRLFLGQGIIGLLVARLAFGREIIGLVLTSLANLVRKLDRHLALDISLAPELKGPAIVLCL